MAYDSNNLSALTYANGFTLWHYKTPDAAAVVDSTGYFNEAAACCGSATSSSPTPTSARPSRPACSSSTRTAGGVVDVADITGFGATDTD